MRTDDRATHWETVYRTKRESDVSWHQGEPTLSVELAREFAPPRGRIIDIGGGSSLLAGRLTALRFDVTVVDVSASAIKRAKTRIGELSRQVSWIVADVTEIEDLAEFDLWHDRAVFHFLTSEADRRRYAALAERTVRSDGHIVIGTFALDGPDKCSGLPVERYDGPKLSAALGPAFTIVRSLHETHVTPWGKPQPFFFAAMRRVSGGTTTKTGSMDDRRAG